MSGKPHHILHVGPVREWREAPPVGRRRIVGDAGEPALVPRGILPVDTVTGTPLGGESHDEPLSVCRGGGEDPVDRPPVQLVGDHVYRHGALEGPEAHQ